MMVIKDPSYASLQSRVRFCLPVYICVSVSNLWLLVAKKKRLLKGQQEGGVVVVGGMVRFEVKGSVDSDWDVGFVIGVEIFVNCLMA